MRALALNCTLKTGDEKSSTDAMLDLIEQELASHDVEVERLRVVNFNVKPGVKSDEGEGDDWPAIRRKLLDSSIFILATPIWLGQPSSVARRVLERMDAFLGETDGAGRMVSYGRVAAVAVVGNEDGAHHVSAELYQALNDVGFTLAPNAVAYWVGEAMKKTNFDDLDRTPEMVAKSVAALARNATHLAKFLARSSYPGEK